MECSTEIVCRVCGKSKPPSEYYWKDYSGKPRIRACKCKACWGRLVMENRRARNRAPEKKDCIIPKGTVCGLCGGPVSRYLHAKVCGQIYCVDCGWAMREAAAEIPVRRADCKHLPRPCPVLSCRFNLAGDKVLPGPWMCAQRHAIGCVADILDDRPGPKTLEEVGDMFGVTRERIRQIEKRALRKMKTHCERDGIDFERFMERLSNWDNMEAGTWDQNQKHKAEYRRRRA